VEFDFVIVGAGSAGCVLANRLSAAPQHRVALVEAGGRDWNPWIHVPAGYFRTMGNPATDWCLRTEPDPGLNGRSIPWPRGRVLGGSSSINGLLHVRGQRQDYDCWRQLGNAGWSFDDVLPYFRKSETWTGPGGADDGERGREGPLAVSEVRLRRKVVDLWIGAAVRAGYPRNADYNAGAQEGVGHFQQTAVRGRRCSAAVAYLRPARRRRNLAVLTGRQVTGLRIADGRVVGVRLRRGRGEPEGELAAAREVILAAGAVGSPHILMLSGIGPGAELRGAGIPVRAELGGVGRNLQDHLQARPVFRTELPTVNVEVNAPLKRAWIAARYLLLRTGPMTMAASLGFGFLKTCPALETPDIQFHVQPFSADSPDAGPHAFSAFTASVTQLRPESAGSIRLRPADPTSAPAIHPNYLAAETDRRTLVEGVRIARRIARESPLADHVADEHAPGPAVGDGEGEILEWIRNSATTIYHPTGTCRMGPDQDPMAVVDERLRVRQLSGLRVADASVMPRIVSGNTNAPTIMIGEKASDMILQDARP